MTYDKFLELVRTMRIAQANYFRHRTNEWLAAAKAAERAVDAELAKSTPRDSERKDEDT